jgi:4-amino-4-deoxy-L-arabinose transferase-like glycosyltransferase
VTFSDVNWISTNANRTLGREEVYGASACRRGRLIESVAAVPPLAWVLLLTLVCLLPFLNKAFFIDDTLFLRAAEQIQKHPLDFYGFKINWFGYTSPMTEAFENPPLTCYYIAFVASLFGWSEPALHLAFLLPALAAAWGTYRLACSYCERPILAAVIAVLSPVFLISATSVMCDVMLLAFWVWALVLFEKGLQSKNTLLFVWSGLLAGLAFLTKYPALCLIPLLGAYGLIAKRKAGWWLVAPLIPLAFVGGYEWLTHGLYGQGLLLSAAQYASKYRARSHEHLWEKVVVGLGFTGGCFLPVLFYTPRLWSRRTLLFGICLAAGCGLMLPWMSTFADVLWREGGGLNWGSLCLLAVLVGSGVQVACVAWSDLWKRRDMVGLLLCLWITGVLAFAVVGNWTVNARSLLPAVPAVGIIVARRMTFGPESPAQTSGWSRLWPLVAACATSLILAGADSNLANLHRAVARELGLKHKSAGHTVWFSGHWGWQYYLEQIGATPLEIKSPTMDPKDIIISPTSARAFALFDSKRLRLLETKEYCGNTFCATMNASAGTGFYAAGLGPLPFVFGHLKPEDFSVFEVLAPDR